MVFLLSIFSGQCDVCTMAFLYEWKISYCRTAYHVLRSHSKYVRKSWRKKFFTNSLVWNNLMSHGNSIHLAYNSCTFCMIAPSLSYAIHYFIQICHFFLGFTKTNSINWKNKNFSSDSKSFDDVEKKKRQPLSTVELLICFTVGLHWICFLSNSSIIHNDITSNFGRLLTFSGIRIVRLIVFVDSLTGREYKATRYRNITRFFPTFCLSRK